jgi:hypothetical protein
VELMDWMLRERWKEGSGNVDTLVAVLFER